jgi:hypothetical protein
MIMQDGSDKTLREDQPLDRVATVIDTDTVLPWKWGNTFLQNVDYYLPIYMVTYFWRH